MTGDELAAALYAEQGYLVLASDNVYQVGQALPLVRGVNSVSIVPLVKCATDEADYLKQVRRARELGPERVGVDDGRKPYYYRVVAAD